MSGAIVVVLASVAAACWIVLLATRGGFWLCRERDDRGTPLADPARWPAVVAVIPARNEADMIPEALGSLLGQSYPGIFSVILVDDQSEDGTASVARVVADEHGGRLTVLPGAPLAAGWTGKLWALKQGIDAVPDEAEYLLLTDADIAYRPHALRDLVTRAESGKMALVSLMARLRCVSLAERALIPAFIFFFQMLYPFRWVNRPRALPSAGPSDRRSDLGSRTAAAAGGCMLVRREALVAAGGIASIRGALIDDCALAARLKRQGPIWLGLTERIISLRPYPRFDDIRRMVARSAYAQLRFSPLLLMATTAGLTVAYILSPGIALFGAGLARGIAVVTWAMMAVAFVPTLRFYGRSLLWAPVLPAIAAAYLGFTLDSAYQHLRGRGGFWKGRVQALVASDDRISDDRIK